MVRGLKNTVSKELILEAIEAADGLIRQAAIKLNMPRKTLADRIYADPDLKLALEEARERTIDEVEALLVDACRRGELTAMIFYLKCQARKRGYSEFYQNRESGAVIDTFLTEVRQKSLATTPS